MPVKVNALDHLVINVRTSRAPPMVRKNPRHGDQGVRPGRGPMPRTSLHFGNQKINVRPVDGDKVDWFTADHEAAGSDDLCFLTSSTPDEVAAHLKAYGVAIEEAGPRQGARGTLRSVYCRDPDGSLIEISSYEDGGSRTVHEQSSWPGLSRASTSAVLQQKDGMAGTGPAMTKRDRRFARRAIRWQKGIQETDNSSRQGCAGGIFMLESQAPGVVGPFAGMDVPWLLGCARERGASIRS